jgi:MoxR-like ATPase
MLRLPCCSFAPQDRGRQTPRPKTAVVSLFAKKLGGQRSGCSRRLNPISVSANQEQPDVSHNTHLPPIARARAEVHGDDDRWVAPPTQLRLARGRLARCPGRARDRPGAPLLLRGEPGIGKTILAEAAAHELGWRHYHATVTSRTEARDILWHQNVIRRLADAQVKDQLKEDRFYLEPRALWWAFDRTSASRRGPTDIGLPVPIEPNVAHNEALAGYPAVARIDEIDKADPAVANDMLELLDQRRFTVEGTTSPFEVHFLPPGGQELPPLVVLTTNEERDLPQAFLRRCIVHTMSWPGPERPDEVAQFRTFVQEVAQAHWLQQPEAKWDDDTTKIFDAIWNEFLRERQEAAQQELRAPGLAELLDGMRVIQGFGIKSEDPLWLELLRLTWRKSPARQEN